MQYPEDFQAAVKAVYPDWPQLHAALDAGSELVGRQLDDNRTNGVPIDFVLSATTLEEVQQKARELQTRNDLYHQWLQLYYQQKEATKP